MRIIDGSRLILKTSDRALTKDEKVDALLQAMEYADIIQHAAKQLSEDVSSMAEPDHETVFFATSPIYAMGKEVTNLMQALLDDLNRPEPATPQA